jgi:hypothetical protein
MVTKGGCRIVKNIKPTRTARICVKCGDRLGRQKSWHKSTKKQYKSNYFGTWQYFCQGPGKTPGGGRGTPRRPVHFRYYASTGSESLCGLRGGRMSGKYKSDDAQIPWSRLNVKLEQTTCEECLALVAVAVDNQLRQRLAITGGDVETALERARTRWTMNSLEKLVAT